MQGANPVVPMYMQLFNIAVMHVLSSEFCSQGDVA